MQNVLRRFSFMILFSSCFSGLASAAESDRALVAEVVRVVAGERFVDNGDGTVTDTKRKIMWQKGDNGKEVTFEEAQEYCKSLRLGGHADWRLPKPDERDTAVVVELMMPRHSRMPMRILISIGHPTPRS